VIAPMDTRQQIMSPENQAEVTVKKKMKRRGDRLAGSADVCWRKLTYADICCHIYRC
jgi:hypothetical protein